MIPMCFFLHSEDDAKMAKKLKMHLSSMTRERLIEFQSMDDVDPSFQFKDDTRRAIQAADFVLLGMSDDLVSHDDAWKMVQFANKERDSGRLQVVPIILRPIDMDRLMNNQPLPRNKRPISKWDDKDEAWVEVVLDLRSCFEFFIKNNK